MKKSEQTIKNTKPIIDEPLQMNVSLSNGVLDRLSVISAISPSGYVWFPSQIESGETKYNVVYDHSGSFGCADYCIFIPPCKYKIDFYDKCIFAFRSVLTKYENKIKKENTQTEKALSLIAKI